ncbi:MAG: FecR domain-containing protein [Balneolales bacterium]|nr:FecR domain-containing protein [Balneolales bacterium]
MKNLPETRLLKKYLDGTLAKKENDLIENWLDENPENVEHLYNIANDNFPGIRFDKQKVKDALLRSIQSKPALKKLEPKVHKKKRIPPVIRVAAILVLMVGVGVITFSTIQTKSSPQVVEKQTTSPSQTITQVTLSDGTVVELNANSTLYYPEQFPADQRVVRLEGEAFFDVTSETLRPFRVITGELTTTVLGTKFNIQHRNNTNQTEVALVEGSVLVSIADSSKQEIILEPDQWIRYTPGRYISEIHEGIGNKIVWRKNILEFEGRILTEVVDILEAWYGIPIHTPELDAGECQVVGTFKDESLENVLNGLQFVTGISYELNEEEVILSGGSCR